MHALIDPQCALMHSKLCINELANPDPICLRSFTCSRYGWAASPHCETAVNVNVTACKCIVIVRHHTNVIEGNMVCRYISQYYQMVCIQAPKG